MHCNYPVGHTVHQWRQVMGSSDSALASKAASQVPAVAYFPYQSAVNSVHRPLTFLICCLASYAMEMQTDVHSYIH